MISRILLIALIGLTAVLGCHVSCNCDPDSNICTSCKDANSQLDANNRSCPCNSGFFTKTLNPFLCEQYLHSDANGNDLSIPVDACALEIATKTKDAIVKIQSKFYVDANDQTSYVQVDFSLDFSQVSMTPACQSAYQNKIQYKIANNWIDVDPSEISVDANGKSTIKIQLIKLFDYSDASTFGAEQIAQSLSFQAFIGVSPAYVRVHQWDLFVYTNRDETQTFLVDVTIQTTNGCEPNSECIVVADLETLSQICEDDTCAAVRASNVYQIGDKFYAKVWFADPSYTKHLEFVSAYTKDSNGVIYNVTPLVVATTIDFAIILELTLVETGEGIIIQFNFKIAENRLRNLSSSSSAEEQTAQVQLEAHVLKATSNTDSITTNNSMILLVLGNLLAFFLLL